MVVESCGERSDEQRGLEWSRCCGAVLRHPSQEECFLEHAVLEDATHNIGVENALCLLLVAKVSGLDAHLSSYFTWLADQVKMINSGIYYTMQNRSTLTQVAIPKFQNRRLSTVASRVCSVGLVHDINLNAPILFKIPRNLQALLVLVSWWWVIIREISVWLDTLGPSKHSKQKKRHFIYACFYMISIAGIYVYLSICQMISF